MDLKGSIILRYAGLLVMSFLLLTTISCDDEGEPEEPTVPVEEVPPTATAMPATSVGTTYATLNATYEEGKNYGIVETGFIFWESVIRRILS